MTYELYYNDEFIEEGFNSVEEASDHALKDCKHFISRNEYREPSDYEIVNTCTKDCIPVAWNEADIDECDTMTDLEFHGWANPSML